MSSPVRLLVLGLDNSPCCNRAPRVVDISCNLGEGTSYIHSKERECRQSTATTEAHSGMFLDPADTAIKSGRNEYTHSSHGFPYQDMVIGVRFRLVPGHGFETPDYEDNPGACRLSRLLG